MSLPKDSREIVKDSRYDFFPLHQRPEFTRECCKLLNSEWRRSETARLRSLKKSCDNFPTCLLLLMKNKVIGHCKVSPTHHSDAVVIESFIIDKDYRCQGYGSMLLRSVEDYIRDHDKRSIYLMTRGQEEFYSKNGYIVCDPNEQINRWTDVLKITNEDDKVQKEQIVLASPLEKEEKFLPPSSAPPPPPMPTDLYKHTLEISIIPDRTFMKKHMWP